jgi:Cd2+/Zn2+-exporting ATPase
MENLNKELTNNDTIKKEFALGGLDCAVCAEKIAAAVRETDGVARAEVDFAAQKLYAEVYGSAGVSERIIKAVKKTESKVKAVELRNGKKVEGVLEDAREKRINVFRSVALIIGAALFFIALAFKLPKKAELALYISSYVLIGGEVVFTALKNILKGRVFDENFLMSLATAGAFAIAEYPEGVAVMLFYQIGEAFSRLAVRRSRRSIAELMDIRPDYANLRTESGVARVSPEDVKIDDLIIVRAGEKVPLDGVVEEGHAAMDLSALTGESLPKDVEAGNAVLSGSLNLNGFLTVRVKKPFGESTVSKILELVQNASSKKSTVESFITKFAKIYTPLVVLAAAALALIPPLATGAAFSEWIRRALVFLVVSCPCALVISVPLGIFGGIGGASRLGVLVKGGNFLEALSNIGAVVFDKTGTLTKGVFKVTEIKTENGFSESDLLYLAAHAESGSNHPIAASVTAAFGGEINAGAVSDYKEIAGKGITATVDGRRVAAGNADLMAELGIAFELHSDAAATIIYLAVDGVLAGTLAISDEIKDDALAAVDGLRASGVQKIVMLTGDGEAAANKVSQALALDGVHFGLLPQEKVEKLEEIMRDKGRGNVAFVGDGINDAAVLARADIGVAMGAIGSDAAIEAADVVIMSDEPSKLVAAAATAKKTRLIVAENIAFALGVKAAVLILGALGYAAMWHAVFADVGVTLLAVLNSMRAMQTKQ